MKTISLLKAVPGIRKKFKTKSLFTVCFTKISYI